MERRGVLFQFPNSYVLLAVALLSVIRAGSGGYDCPEERRRIVRF